MTDSHHTDEGDRDGAARAHTEMPVAPPGLPIAIASLAWAVLTMAAVLLGSGPVRATAVLVFLIAVPGTAVVGWLELDDSAVVFSLTFGFGIAIGIATAQILVWSHTWVPEVAFWCLSTACIVVLACQIAWFTRRMQL